MSESQPISPEPSQEAELQLDPLSQQIQNVLGVSKTFSAMHLDLQEVVSRELHFLTSSALRRKDIRWNNSRIPTILTQVIDGINLERTQREEEPYDLNRFYDELTQAAAVHKSGIVKSFNSSVTKLWQMVQRGELSVRDLQIVQRQEKKALFNVPGEDRFTNPDQTIHTSPKSKEDYILSDL